jgi:hypothetical protein
MPEWWSYRPADLLLFSARTYERLFERVNAEAGATVWLPSLLALGVLVAGRTGWRGAAPAGALLLAAAWAWVGWAYHATRFAEINPAATGYAVAFGLQASGWLVAAARATSPGSSTPAPLPVATALDAGSGPAARATGVVLLGLALAMPAWGALSGAPVTAAEWFGFAPDPTAIAALGALLLWPRRRSADGWLWWALWPIPLLWCVISGVTLSAMQSPQAMLPPAAAGAALAALVLRRWSRRGGRPGP